MVSRYAIIPPDGITITHDGKHFEFQCLIFVAGLTRSEMINRIAVEMTEMTNVERFTVAHSSRA